MQHDQSSGKLFAGAALFAVGAGLALPIDLWVTEHVRYELLPGDIRRLVVWSEMFAHGLGAGLILAAIFYLDRQNRKALRWAMAATLSAGLVANLCKLLIARTRPHHFEDGFAIWDSFGGILPVLWVEPWGHAMQSFPSGHTATAVGLALGLQRLYPRARPILIACAALAGFQRIAAGAHFLSDVLAGAAVGLVTVGLINTLANRLAQRRPTGAPTPTESAPREQAGEAIERLVS